MADDLTYIPERKRLAMGGDLPSGDFGVEKLGSKEVNGPSGRTDGKYLKDDERGARSPIKGNQANPNHGYD